MKESNGIATVEDLNTASYYGDETDRFRGSDGIGFDATNSDGDDFYVGSVLVGAAWQCPYRMLCEELYPEPEMVSYRKRCNRDFTRYCSHYWAFHDGYHDMDDD